MGEGQATTRGARLVGGLVAMIGVAVALRAYAWQHTHTIFNDGPIFLSLADAIAAGRGSDVLAHPFHPLYPAAIAAVRSIAGCGAETAAVAVSIAGGAMAVLGAFLFVRRAFDPLAGWMAGWVVALHPWAVDFSADVMSDGLYAGLFGLGFAALASLIDHPRPTVAVACGGLAGLAYLVRPEGIGLIVLAVGLLGARAVLDRGAFRAAAASAGLVAVTAGVVMAPFAFSLADQTGQWTLTRKKTIGGLVAGRVDVRIETPSAATEGAVLPAAESIPLPVSAERIDGTGARRPDRSVVGALEAVSRAVRTSIAALRYEVALFVLIGLFSLRDRPRGWRGATIGLTALLYIGVLVLLVWGAGYVARRHALAALLPLVGYAAIGWRALHGQIAARAPAHAGWLRRPGCVGVGLVLVLALVWGPRDLRERRLDRSAVRGAAEWLAEHGGEGEGVAAQKLRIAYYAGGRYVPLPSGSEAPIQTTLREQGVRWVVIEEVRLDDHRGLTSGMGDWLQIRHVEAAAGRRALVLEMR